LYQIPHEIILTRIKSKIGDSKIIELITKFIKAGYIEPVKLVSYNMGTPQGGLLSPLLANIVLHELDKFMDSYTKNNPSKEGNKRRISINPIYKKLARQRGGSIDPVKRLRILRKIRLTRRTLITDPKVESAVKKIEYIRYADDFIVLVSGSIQDAKNIQQLIKDFLKSNCGLELNMKKSVISNMLNEKWSFLGADIRKLRAKPEWRVKHVDGKAGGVYKLMVNASINKIIMELKKGGFVRQNHLGAVLPQAHTPIVNLTHYEILSFFNLKIHGILNFYSFASNRFRLWRVIWLLKASCALTLARKLKLKTIKQVFKRFGSNLKCPDTDVTLFYPTSLKVLHDFKSNADPKKLLHFNKPERLNLKKAHLRKHVKFVDPLQT